MAGEGADLADALLGDSLSVAKDAGGNHPVLSSLQVSGELTQEEGVLGLGARFPGRLGGAVRLSVARGVGGAKLSVAPALGEVVGPALVGW